LEQLHRVKEATGLPVLTDVHEPHQAGAVAAVVDALQVPALLSRQTDLLRAAGSVGLPVNVKKGQWMAPEAMRGAVDKVRGAGAREIAVTERGTFFGYGDLVVDPRSFRRLREATLAPVLFDATHAVQQPGRGEHGASGGVRDDVPGLLFAAAGAGVDGFFLETHPQPASAPSDAASMWPLAELEPLVRRAVAVWRAARQGAAERRT
jgi:2-dehydro-3-deoxyphosphooctonate aldolase (KDO 8-P synthase)